MKRRTRDEALTERTRLQRIRPRLEQRSRIAAAIRGWFAEQGFLEVDTPTRIRAPAPEAHIDAVASGDRFLVTSPELQMKRLLAAGYERLFQLCHCFRAGERGALHLPEFQMVEWYRSGAGIDDLMQDCERLIQRAAETVSRYPEVTRQGLVIDLTPPWPRLEIADLFAQHALWRPGAQPDEERFERDLVEKVEPALPSRTPVFAVGYPAALASLSRLDPLNPARALRFELYAGGLELANGFAELCDPKEQARRFESELLARSRTGRDVYPLDESFLAALELGLEPCAGIALGLDRLVMLLLSAEQIDEVTAFPEESV